MLQFVFWTCIFLVLYTYIGYAILIYILARLFPYPIKERSQNSDGYELPPLTLFITAYNEAEIIQEKMSNCLELDYPEDKIHILWVIDGSTDDSRELLAKYPMVKIVGSAHRKGKTAAVNHGMEYVKTPIVVFSDANCLLNAGTLKIITRQFEDPTIGCVSGEKRVAFDNDDTVSSKGEGAYWKYESLLKRLDFEFYSAVGAAGELFAVRTELFAAMEEDTLLDDFMLSMRIALKGYRIAYTADAYAVEYGSLNMEEEGKRKRRIAAGGWQSIGRLLPLLNGFKFGKLSFQYISHRVLRWSVTPFALFTIFPLAALLGYCNSSLLNVFNIIFVAQCLFYLCAAVGYLMRNNPNSTKLYYIPYYFLFMNINVIRGIYYLFSRSFIGGWEKSQRK
ncbi:glycosyl transferase [Sphingobacterium siyangense]|uniref:Glycosyl transferase n=1 Tax=Sphingobacterium siyangense TaxID=459529 RepID=A0A420FHZ6_9SPHI|nr:glycosyltransferase family 2 protein [Sphingobacterium siyangense]RKF32548.1 glycosyl transferase [Sphingobacterium siyangense]